MFGLELPEDLLDQRHVTAPDPVECCRVPSVQEGPVVPYAHLAQVPVEVGCGKPGALPGKAGVPGDGIATTPRDRPLGVSLALLESFDDRGDQPPPERQPCGGPVGELSVESPRELADRPAARLALWRGLVFSILSSNTSQSAAGETGN